MFDASDWKEAPTCRCRSLTAQKRCVRLFGGKGGRRGAVVCTALRRLPFATGPRKVGNAPGSAGRWVHLIYPFLVKVPSCANRANRSASARARCPVPVPEVPVPVAQCPVPVVPSRVPVPIPVYGERATIASPAAAQKPDSWWCQMVPKMVPVPVPMPAVVPVPNPVYASANVPVLVPMRPCPCQCAPCQCQCARAIDGASASAEVVPIVCRKYCMVVRKQGTLSYQQTSDVCTCGICGA